MSEQNKALVRRLVQEVWNEGNLDALNDLLAPDFVQHGVGPAIKHGPKAIADFREFMQGMATAVWGRFPVWSLERLIAEGDFVVAMIRDEPVARGDWRFGVTPAPDKTYIEELDVKAPTSIHVYRIANGKIAEQWQGFNLPSITIGRRLPRSDEEDLYQKLASQVGACGGTAFRLERLAGEADSAEWYTAVAACKDEYLHELEALRGLVGEIEERFASTELLERFKGKRPGWDRVAHLFEPDS